MTQSADRTSGRISPQTIGEILVSEGEVNRDQLDEAWGIHEGGNRGLGEILISLGHTTPENLSKILSRRLNTQYVVLSEEQIDPELVNLVQKEVLIACGAVPLHIQDGSLVVAMKDPGDDEARSCVVRSAGQPIIAMAASEDAIHAAHERFLNQAKGSQNGKTGNGDRQTSPQHERPGKRRGPGRLGDILISEGKITQEQLEHALELQNETSKNLGDVLLSLSYIESADLAWALAQRLRLDYVVISELSGAEVDNEALDLMEEPTLRKYRALPLRFEGDKLVVAMSDPNDLHALEDLRMIAGRPITPVVVTEEDLEGALDHLFGSEDVYYEEEQPVDTDATPDPSRIEQDEPEPVDETPSYEPNAAVEEYATSPDTAEATSNGEALYPEPEEEREASKEDGVAEVSATDAYQAEEEHAGEPFRSGSQTAVPRRGRGALSGRGRMGEILVSQGKISEEQLRLATEMQRDNRRELGEILLTLGYVTKSDLSQAMAQRLKLDFVELTDNDVDRGLLTLIDQRILRKHGVMPVRLEDGNLFVAMSDPKDLYALEDLRMICRLPGDSRGRHRAGHTQCTEQAVRAWRGGL